MLMKRLTTLFVTAALAVCCTDRALSPESGEPGHIDDSDMIVLGERLEDPYTVENMTKALNALYPTKAADRVPVRATHRYMRFLPKDEKEMNKLEELGIVLLDHPMDYEIVREGDWYHDPEIPEGEITWQYAAVPIATKVPLAIKQEELYRCYIPNEFMLTKSDDGIDWAAVEREAFRLTGNESLLPDAAPTKSEKSGGTPSGRITIIDAARPGSVEGLRGVRVECNSFVKVANAYTDEDGRYRMTRSFSGNPRYRLVFKNSSGFCIGVNLLFVPASVASLGAGVPSGIDVTIDQDSDRRRFCRCVVNNAGYDYYHRCAQASPAIKTPPSNLRLWLFQTLDVSVPAMLQQGAIIDNSKLGQMLGYYAILLKLFMPDVLMGLKGKDSYADIYGEALHAFAHASHFMAAGRDYWDQYVRFLVTSFVTSGLTVYGVGTEDGHGYCEVAEMWAYFLQTVLYRERYGAENTPSFGTNWWFHPQILLRLEERGLDANRIFQVLDADVTDRELFKKKLISYYPEHKSAINEAFAKYN